MIDYTGLLRDHVTLRVRSLDRMFFQAYLPKLQTVGQVCTFLRWQRNFKIPSSAAFGQIGRSFEQAVHRFAEEHKIPIVRFKKGQNKEEFVRPYIEEAARQGEERVVLIGIAQEKASSWRSWPAKGQEKAAHPHMEWARQMTFINHFYFYLWDAEFGGAFWKTNAYAPWPIWVYVNGHEWAKRQLVKAGIGYQPLDNGFRSCEDPIALQNICDRLGPGALRSFFWRWLWRLPSPLTTKDFRAGYSYELAFRQFEVSETCVFDRPQAGRMWFESVIRDHLDVGRPDQVAIFFNRSISRRTPGSFRTRVVQKGVEPILTCYYKSSRLKQYFKEGWALRTETVICDTRDFDIGRRVGSKNWHALRAVGESANRRLCEAEAADAFPAPDVLTLDKVSRPSITEDGLYSPGLRFGDPRVMAVLASLVGFVHVVVGFTNRQMRELVASLLRSPYGARQGTYDLRRLRRKGLIIRIASTQRYQLTSLGRRVAVLFTKAYGRVLAPGLTALSDLPPRGSPVGKAWRSFERALEDYIRMEMLAA
jgi:hypothetical protein